MSQNRYPFDVTVSRGGTNSMKWNYAKELAGVEDALPMWVADMDFETVPEVREAILERARHGIYGYTIRPPEYYDSIIEWNRKRHGWRVEKEWITHSAGVVNALYTAVRALTEPGNGVMIQPPVYHPFYSAITKNGCIPVLNPLRNEAGRYIPDLEDFERKLKAGGVKLFLLCNPHNPVGRVFTAEELEAMGSLCLKHGVTVLSDEIHSDLVYKPHRHLPFAALSREFAEHAVIFTAPSKTFNLAGLSTSNLIIPNEELRQRYNLANENTAQKGYNLFGAVACEAAYRYGEAWLDQLLDYLQGNVRYAAQYLETHLPELTVTAPEGTYFLWVDCRSLGLDQTELERFLLHEAKLWFNQGYMFGPEGSRFIRINLACQRSTLETALNRLQAAVGKRRLQAAAKG